MNAAAFATLRRFGLRFALLAGLFGLAALLLSSASTRAASDGRAGRSVALQAALHPLQAQVALQSAGLTPSRFVYDPHAPQYRLRPQTARRAGGRKALIATAAPVQIDEPTQTYDVFAPPPAFLPPTSAPLQPANMTPVWTSDERFLVFARQVTVNNVTHTHLFSISAKGDAPTTTPTLHQITTGSGDESFPALNPINNSQLAFTSTAANGTPQLYVVQNFSPQASSFDPIALTPLTVRPDLTGGNPVAMVGRPTWNSSGTQLAFAATDAGGPNAGTSHIYQLFVSSGGGNSGSASSPNNPPLKLTDGPASDTDPAWSPDGQYIAFASNASSINSNALPVLTATPTTVRSLFLISTAAGTAQRITGFAGGTRTGNDDFGPAWNQAPDGTGQLAFSRALAGDTAHDIYYYLAYAQDPNTGTYQVFPEGGTAAQINTDDAANAYDDIYPTFSPSPTLPQIAYSSPRSITYNNPANGNPTEKAVSLAPGTAGAFGVTVGPNYAGILVSREFNINPPTLLPYTAGEVIHVTDATGVVRRNGDIRPGAPVTLTVRLSNRESGTDPNNVYLQFKDPDSRYQDTNYANGAGLEHKVFTKDVTDFAANPDSSSSATNYLYNGGAVGVVGGPVVLDHNATQNFKPASVTASNPAGEDLELRGAVGGYDGNVAIALGYNGGGTNPVIITKTVNNAPVMQPLPGGNPARFTTFGQEYECQYLNAQFAQNGTADTTLADYGTPYYLAGVDDQQPGSAPVTPRPEWLHLARAATQDANGGILYTATWTSPISPSDYYLDVIAYDQASNWRIYDNVWGFSTQPFNGSADILVVSDNTLGQKFVGTTFGNTGLFNIPPIFYGAESYFTDIDINKLPNAIFRYAVPTGQMPKINGVLQPDDEPQAEVIPLSGTLQQDTNPSAVFNGLGVNSYAGAPDINQSTVIGGVRVAKSQQYSLWRVLARGAVSPNVLAAYSPSFKAQPAVNDTQAGVAIPAADGTTIPLVPDAHRCVVWASPYTGDLPLNVTGSLADSQTQQLLRAFVLGGQYSGVSFAGGGRLFVSGQDVASALTLDGTVPSLNTAGSFLTDVLNASLVTPSAAVVDPGNQGNQGLSATAGRIAGDAYFNPGNTGQVQDFFTQAIGNSTFVYTTPSAKPLILGNNYVSISGAGAKWRTDGSLTQLGPALSSFGLGFNVAESQIDIVVPQNGAHTEINFAGPGSGASPASAMGVPGLIYNENLTTGQGRVVYASFGLEGLGIEYYKFTENSNDSYYPYNQRPNVLHNIVSYLRTGTVTGTIVAGSGGGQGVPNATVYLIPNGGAAFPSNRQTFSALTAADGTFRMDGVEPGVYYAVAYKSGYTRAQSNTTQNINGDTFATFSLNLISVPPGSISGQVTDKNTGNGIPNATVTFDDGSGTAFSATTDSSGNYTVSAAPAGTYSAKASASGYTPSVPTMGIVVSSGGAATANFALSTLPAIITVEVVDATTGAVLPGASVTIAPDSNKAGVQITGANGRTAFANVPSSIAGIPYTLAATLAGYTSASAMQMALPGKTPLVTLRLTALPPGTLGGIVKDGGTQSDLTGATVSVFAPGGTTPLRTVTTGTTSSPAAPSGDGTPLNYTLSLGAGTYDVSVSKTGYVTQKVTGVVVTSGQFTRADFAGMTALTTPPATINVTVVDAATRTVQPGASVTITPDPNGAGAQTTDANGAAAFANLPTSSGGPVTYTLTVTLAGFADGTATQAVVPGQTVAVTIALLPPPNGTLGGIVKDGGLHVDLAGAAVTVFATGTTTPLQTVTTGTTSAPGAPSGDGNPQNYAFSLKAGTYDVSVSKTGFGTKTLTGLVVTSGKFTRADFAGANALTSPPATINVTVVDASDGTVLPGASVTIAPDPNGAGVKKTGTAGTASFPNLPASAGGPVTYTLSASLATYKSASATQAVTPGQIFNVTVRLVPPPKGTLGGLVNDGGLHAPLAGATVTVLVSGTATVVQTTTTTPASSPAAPSGDGNPQNYAFSLKAGTYDVSVSKSGFTTQKVTGVVVRSQQFTRADFSGNGALAPLHVFPAGLNFFSVPYDYSGTSFDTLLGPYPAVRSHVVAYQPQLLQYVTEPTPPADAPRLGQGYWVRLTQPAEVTAVGTAPTGPTVSVPLRQGWNMIGVPSTTAISVSALTFPTGSSGTPVSFTDATGAAYRLIFGTLYAYPPGASAYSALGAGGSLQPWQAYWIYAYVDTTVLIPTS